MTCYCIKKFKPKVWVNQTKPLLICKMFMLWLTSLWICCCMPAHTFSVWAFFKKESTRSRALCADSINSVRIQNFPDKYFKAKILLPVKLHGSFTSYVMCGKFIICQPTYSSMAFAVKLLKINTISCWSGCALSSCTGKINALLFYVPANFNSMEYEYVTGALINAHFLPLPLYRIDFNANVFSLKYVDLINKMLSSHTNDYCGLLLHILKLKASILPWKSMAENRTLALFTQRSPHPKCACVCGKVAGNLFYIRRWWFCVKSAYVCQKRKRGTGSCPAGEILACVFQCRTQC